MLVDSLLALSLIFSKDSKQYKKTLKIHFMKRFYFTVLCAVLSLSGCVNSGGGVDEPTEVGRTTLNASTGELVLNIGTEQLNGVEAHTWSTATAIGAFGSQGGANAKYTLFNKYDGMAEGLFFGAEVKGTVYAYYPYNKDASAEGSEIALTLPDKQTYNADLVTQYEQHSKILVAKSDDGNLVFEHLYGCLAIEIEGEYTINKLKLSSDTEPLAGRVAVNFENNMQSSAIARSLYELTLDCGEGVRTSAEQPTKFYFLLPPATYTSLSLEVTTPEGSLSKQLLGNYTVNRVSSISLEESMTSAIIKANFAELALAGNTSERTWKAGSEIGIFSDNSKNTQYLMITPGDQKEAQFIGLESKGNLLAYYPYSANAKLENNKLLLVASDSQKYDADLLKQFQQTTPFMIASAEEGNPLSFDYVMGALGMRVSANMNIKYIELTSASKPLSGRLWVDLENGYTCTENEVGTKYMVTLDASEAKPETTLENPTTFYVMLPVGEYEDLLVTITSTEGDILAVAVDEKITIKKMDLASIAEDITYQTIDIELENAANGKKVWEDGDMVSVYSTDRGRGIKSRMLANVGTAKNQAIAVGTPNETYNVFYPASILTSELSEKAVFTFPAEQHYNTDAISKETQIYAGTSSEGKCTLYLLNSILAVDVTASYANCEISSLMVSSKNHALAGTMTAIFNAADERPTCTLDGASNSIRVIFDEPIVLAGGESRTFYISIPVGTYEKNDITVTAGATLGATVETSMIAIEAEAASTFDIALSTIKATNLTEGGKYANTFVLPNKKGWYMFDAKARGGYEKDEDNNSLITPSAVAGCLFEKNGGMITNVGICNNSKSISFYYDGSKGNASVATFEDGGVLWAWYLWCPANEQPEDIVMGSRTYLDRNLGAYNVPTTQAEVLALDDVKLFESGGLFFQWGRPSPFPTVVKYEQEAWASRLGQSTNTISQTYYYPSAHLITKPSYGAAAADSKKIHTAFTCSNQTTWTSAAAATKDPLMIGCYLNDASSRYWDTRCGMNVSHADASWNYSNEAHKQYDPCPYGYEVPFADDFVADAKAFLEGKTTNINQATEAGKMFKGGYYFFSGNKMLWNPVVGGRPHYGLWAHFGSPNTTLIAHSTNTNKKIRIYWGWDEKNNKAAIGASDQGASNWTQSLALPVRCVKK